MFTLHEKKVNVYVREKDKSMMQSLIPEIEKEYKSKAKGRDCKVTLSDKYHLPDNSAGGALITASRDRIKVDNSLDQRLNLCYKHLIPAGREILFPSDRVIDGGEDEGQQRTE